MCVFINSIRSITIKTGGWTTRDVTFILPGRYEYLCKLSDCPEGVAIRLKWVSYAPDTDTDMNEVRCPTLKTMTNNNCAPRIVIRPYQMLRHCPVHVHILVPVTVLGPKPKHTMWKCRRIPRESFLVMLAESIMQIRSLYCLRHKKRVLVLSIGRCPSCHLLSSFWPATNINYDLTVVSPGCVVVQQQQRQLLPLISKVNRFFCFLFLATRFCWAPCLS